MATDDFFRARLDQMIDLRHPLAVLATRMPWADIEASLASAFAHRDRTGRVVQGADLFGPTLAIAGAGVSNAGRLRLPIRLMVALLYLKHATMGTVKKTEFERVIVDTTVQSKAIAHPTDSRLLEVAREKIARLARARWHPAQADPRAQGQDAAPQGRRLRPRQAVQAPAPRAQAPAHDPGQIAAGGSAQDGWPGRWRQVAAGHLGAARRAHPQATAQGQEQAVCAARTRSGVHREGEGSPALRVRRQAQLGGHAPERFDGGRAQLPRQPVRRTHAGRSDRADQHTPARHWRKADHGHRGSWATGAWTRSWRPWR